jgi:ribonuclease HI
MTMDLMAHHGPPTRDETMQVASACTVIAPSDAAHADATTNQSTTPFLLPELLPRAHVPPVPRAMVVSVQDQDQDQERVGAKRRRLDACHAAVLRLDSGPLTTRQLLVEPSPARAEPAPSRQAVRPARTTTRWGPPRVVVRVAASRRTHTRWGPPLRHTPPAGDESEPADAAPPPSRARTRWGPRLTATPDRYATTTAATAAPTPLPRKTAPVPPPPVAPPAAPATAVTPSIAPVAWVLRFDGACRRNPGPGGAGAALFEPGGAVVWTCSYFMPGSETNNSAEYMAMLLGVESALHHGATRLRVEGDSHLALSQVRGTFSCTNRRLRRLRNRVRAGLARLEWHRLAHIDRKANAHADRLANRALDRAKTFVECASHSARRPHRVHHPADRCRIPAAGRCIPNAVTAVQASPTGGHQLRGRR